MSQYLWINTISFTDNFSAFSRITIAVRLFIVAVEEIYTSLKILTFEPLYDPLMSFCNISSSRWETKVLILPYKSRTTQKFDHMIDIN